MGKTILLQTPRFKVVHETRHLPHGTADYYFVSKPDAVVIVPHSKSKVVILETRRHLVDGPCFELPGGRIEDGETAKEAAIRELEEECGLKSTCWKRAATTYPLPSVTTEKVHIFFAEVAIPRSYRSEATDPQESITAVHAMSFARARSLALKAALRCSLDAYALLLFLEAHNVRERSACRDR